MLLYTAAWIDDEDGEPDTVLRLYDQDGNMIAENDDMPFRFWETDSGFYFEAEYDGVYYAEVLEWSDWDPTSEGAVGGSTYEYALVAAYANELDQEPENDTLEGIEGWVNADEGKYAYYSSGFNDYAVEFSGDMDSDTDIDVYPFGFDYSENPDDEGSFYYIFFWTPLTDPSTTLEMWDGEGNVIAQTQEPYYNLDRYYYYDYSSFLYDGGIVMRMATDDYALAVWNEDGAEGAGTFYRGVYTGYTNALADWEGTDADGDIVSLGSSVTMTESTSTAGYYYGRFSGVLGEIETADELDSWRIDAGDTGGSLEGKYLNVYVDAVNFGSMFDPKISIYADDGTTLLGRGPGQRLRRHGRPHGPRCRAGRRLLGLRGRRVRGVLGRRRQLQPLLHPGDDLRRAVALMTPGSAG